MIKRTYARNKGGEIFTDVHDLNVEKTLESLVLNQLGFGGHIVDITPTKVVTFCRVLSDEDTVTFEGTEKEMRPLVEFCAYFLHVSQEEGITQPLIEGAIEATAGSRALIFTAMTPLLVGGNRCKLAALAWAGVEDLEAAQYAMELELEQLLEIALYKRAFPEMSFLDICDEIEPTVPVVDAKTQAAVSARVEVAIDAVYSAGGSVAA